MRSPEATGRFGFFWNLMFKFVDEHEISCMESLNVPSFCVYYMVAGFGVSMGLHLCSVVVAQFKFFLSDAFKGR